MRLLNVDSLEFTTFPRENERPRYVIASHRWVEGSEATFKDVLETRNSNDISCRKVEAFRRYVREKVPSAKWLWIDTCCINKDSAAELSEAINLMFKWYRNAELCLAYLADVEEVEDRRSFEQSEWFRRGWTLQELLAPRTVVFVTKFWQVIGNKGASYNGYCGTPTGPGLETDVAKITGIPEQILHDYEKSRGLSVDMRLRWMEGRETSREEDMSYALYGLFRVTPGANYGEEHEGARKRLLAAIHQQENLTAQQAAYFKKIADWISPPDPWTNHDSARQRHEPQTGLWLLQSDQYKAWKCGSTRHLWLYGKAGCGKTVLCSTAIEDVRDYCVNATNAVYAVFYFSFSDSQKQSYEDLIRSLVVQLGRREPGLSMLSQAYESPGRSLPRVDDLRNILLSSVVSYKEVFLLVDALDECPEDGDARQKMLEHLAELCRGAPNLRILVTSREVSDVRASMELLGAEPMSIAARPINVDIQRYVSNQLLRDPKLSRLDPATRTSIEETLSRKADGMFRWVYCQLQELKRSKSTKPKSVAAALLALPASLDETYDRILTKIEEHDRADALVLLRWLGYAKSPLSLKELAEATIIDTSAEGSVEIENRGSWEDALEILAGLVTLEGSDEGELGGTASRPDTPDEAERGPAIALPVRQIGGKTRLRLAHFSVMEYLESRRILASPAKGFHLDLAREHKFLADSCLVYLRYYSNSPSKTSTKQDLVLFPLLEYVASSWFYHSAFQQGGDFSREMSLLTSEEEKYDWLLVHKPDGPWMKPFEGYFLTGIGSGLYYASVVALEGVVQRFINAGADVDAQDWAVYGTALEAASDRGHEKIVAMLIDAEADVNARAGEYQSCALGAAARGGHEKIVAMLIDAGADINVQGGGFYSTTLEAAVEGGHEKIVAMLLDAGADVNAPGGGFYSTTLEAASARGHEKIVAMLLDAGADVSFHGPGYQISALGAALRGGHEKIVAMLTDARSNANGQGGYYNSTALEAAAAGGHEKIVAMLIERGATKKQQARE